MNTYITTPVILGESAAFNLAGLPHNTVIPREGAAVNIAGLPHNTVIPREGAGSIRQPDRNVLSAEALPGRGMDPGFRRDDGVVGDAAVGGPRLRA